MIYRNVMKKKFMIHLIVVYDHAIPNTSINEKSIITLKSEVIKLTPFYQEENTVFGANIEKLFYQNI